MGRNGMLGLIQEVVLRGVIDELMHALAEHIRAALSKSLS